MVLGPDRKGINLRIPQIPDQRNDSPQCQRVRYFFICEGMYGEDDKADKAKGYKHMTFREAERRLARDARVKEMWLTHYSPSLIRPEEYMETVRGIFAGLSGEGWKKCGTEFTRRNKSGRYTDPGNEKAPVMRQRASVVKNGRTILSNVISSQIELHKLYGGVVPEIASRKHIEKINQVIEEALKGKRG